MQREPWKFSPLSHAARRSIMWICFGYAEFTCIKRTSKNAVSPRDVTIASRSINTEEGSAALVLTRKQEAIARSFPSVRKQFSSSNFSDEVCMKKNKQTNKQNETKK